MRSEKSFYLSKVITTDSKHYRKTMPSSSNECMEKSSKRLLIAKLCSSRSAHSIRKTWKKYSSSGCCIEQLHLDSDLCPYSTDYFCNNTSRYENWWIDYTTQIPHSSDGWGDTLKFPPTPHFQGLESVCCCKTTHSFCYPHPRSHNFQCFSASTLIIQMLDFPSYTQSITLDPKALSHSVFNGLLWDFL